jgi:hypothetical protein
MRLKPKGETTMDQIINAETLNNIISEMQSVKILKKIKVTTAFFVCIRHSHMFQTLNEPFRPIDLLLGVPVEIDDEIKGNYEFVY